MNAERSLLVVGGGPAGITAALQGCELGARVTLLEAGQVGGTSLNRGPAPVRTLARAARLARDWSSWATFGLDGPPPVPNLPVVVANSERVARYAHDKKDMAGHLRRHGIDLVEDLGPVGFVDSHTLAADGGRTWSADRIILAVGGHAGRLRIPGADLALTYEDIPSLVSLPRRVAVVGGADTGCQIASIFGGFGTDVTLFEAGPNLVPAADASVSAELIRAFRARDMNVHTETLVEALSVDGDAIRVDLRTNVEHIFAAGDVNGRSMVVQTARMEGRIAATNAILGPARDASYDVVPSGSFTDPEYGRVGLTEAQAAQQHDVAVGIARYDDLLRPVADGRPDGFCKLIADRRTHAILGAHVLGEYSAETVQTVAACMAAGMTIEQVAELQLAFPTFTEAVCMAAQKICRGLGIGSFPQVWSYLGPED
jgi:pyruvate/2-oxoglutarate dehydrogenase complex dihydrolipoamide dehydrogenase (E3) component